MEWDGIEHPGDRAKGRGMSPPPGAPTSHVLTHTCMQCARTLIPILLDGPRTGTSACGCCRALMYSSPAKASNSGGISCRFPANESTSKTVSPTLFVIELDRYAC